MGLLTDPTGGYNFTHVFLVDHHRKLCLFLFFASIVWLCFLSHDRFSAPTYFSENALLPGLVREEYSEQDNALDIALELDAVLHTYGREMPVDWLLWNFEKLRIEAYVHNFTINSVFTDKKYGGKNVYGILRAPRSASFESLVLSMPYRSKNSIHPTTLPSIALMFSIAKLFRRQKHWAKDVIFLITEHEQVGIQAWLDAYHRTVSGTKEILEVGDLEARGGSIQAAINMEIFTESISSIDVKVLGLNGQLPNLDLFNLVHRICNKEGIPTTFLNKHFKNTKMHKTWLQKLTTLLEMIALQISGVPNGNHGLFHRYGIEAVTIESSFIEPSLTKKIKPISFYRMGRMVEGTFRSLNNLLERFHQSYFFYLLPSSDRFISIGVYMPCVAALVLAMYLKSYSTWLRFGLKKEKYSDSDLNILSISAIVLFSHFSGFVILPTASFAMNNYSGLPREATLSLSIIGTSVASCIFIYSFMKLYNQGKNWTLLNVICLTELGTFLICVSMHNFSFGFVTALIYILPATFISASKNGWLKKFTWVLFHPYLVVYWLVMAATYATYEDLSLLGLVEKTGVAARDYFAMNYMDGLIYGNWTFLVVNGALVPNWIMFWALLNAP